MAAPAQQARTSIHRIDGDDVLRYVNDDWVSFATANDAPGLTPENVIGHSMYDFISGAETRHAYRLLLARVRSRRLTLRVPFRCDSPSKKRCMTLHMRPHGTVGVEFISELRHEETRSPIPLLDAAAPRCSVALRICSWCKRVLACQRWEELEAAIADLGLMQCGDMPELKHSICPECSAIVQNARS
jgi:hypothetical protein